MNRVLLFTVLLSYSLYSCGCENPLSFHIGVVPWAPAGMNQVWANRLNKHLNSHCIDATFGSAKSFKEFLNKAIAQKFDLVDVPPHMASYLMLHHGMNAMAIEDWDADILFITKQDSAIRSLEEMKDQTVLLPDPLSMTSYIAGPLAAQFTKDLQFASNHHQVLAGVLNDQVKVGVLVSPLLNSLKTVVKDRIRIIHRGNTRLPGVLVSTKKIDRQNTKKLMKALSTFDLGTDKFWQTWKHPTSKRIQQIHEEQAPYVKRLLQETL